MTFNSKYCIQYLKELKFTYEGYIKLYELIYDHQKQHQELFNSADEINDERQEKIMEQDG